MSAADLLASPLSVSKPGAWVKALAERIAHAEEKAAEARVKAYASAEEDAEEARALADIDGGVRDGIATVRIHGPIFHARAWVSIWCGLTSPLRIRAVLDRYVAREDVSAVWLDIDSPGGSVSDIPELSDVIAGYPKPIHAVVSGECCSAAYWLACRCATIAARPESTVGSVGVYTLVVDDTERLKAAGLAYAYMTSGPLKAAGLPGTTLTDPQRANIQRYVDDLFALFRAAVLSRRTVSEEVWDGGFYAAATGKALGLVDILI